jgi:dTDP-4-dehydrorhamnose 3,5-epimerase
MIFKATNLKDAYLIELEPIEDHRGFFARSFCQKEFRRHGINMNIVQCNISYNNKRGTLRGMHYQAPPQEEAKLVSCMKGAIYDVIVDIRPDSPTYCKWTGVELTAHCSQLTASYRMLYVPEGFAHGFLTLEDNTEVFYQMSGFYAPGYGRGIKWNDPSFGINWPEEVAVISDQDKSFPDFTLFR